MSSNKKTLFLDCAVKQTIFYLMPVGKSDSNSQSHCLTEVCIFFLYRHDKVVVYGIYID